MTLEEFEIGLEKIGYSLSKDLGSYRVINDNYGNEINLVIWYDKRMEVEIGNKQKIFIDIENCQIKIFSHKTLSFGSTDNSIFIQFYNHERN